MFCKTQNFELVAKNRLEPTSGDSPRSRRRSGRNRRTGRERAGKEEQGAEAQGAEEEARRSRGEDEEEKRKNKYIFSGTAGSTSSAR